MDEDAVSEEVEEIFSQIVQHTRQAYELRNPYLRERMLKQLKRNKQELRKQLASLGIQNLRPVDIAWNYVILYNEKIRQLWIDCNLWNPHEKDRVMKQIGELNHERQQRLAEVDQLPDCPIKTWEFQGWVEAEYREALRPLETEPVEQLEPAGHPETSEQPETLEQPELVVTQPASKNLGFLDNVSGGSEPLGDYDDPKAALEPMGSFELGGQTSFDTAFEDTTSSQRYDADIPGLDTFEKGLFATQSQLESGEAVDDYSDDLFGDYDDDQLDPVPVSCQAVEEAQIPENASHASPITQQASLEEKVTENNTSDTVFSVPDGSSQPEPAGGPVQAAEEPLVCDNNTIADAPVNQQVSQEQQAVEGYAEDNDFPFGGEVEKINGPVAEPDHGTETQLGPGVEASSDQVLGSGPQIPEQAVLSPQEVQPIADQREDRGREDSPPHYLPTYKTLFPMMDQEGLQFLRGKARKDLGRFWPDNKQICSDLQLDLYAIGTDEFKKDELTRYERCLRAGRQYVVEFEEEFDEIPPNKTFKRIYNGSAVFHCFIQNQPDIVDLTGNDSTSSAIAAPLGEPAPALAAPAEIVAADEPVPATVGGEVVHSDDEASEDEDAAPKKASKIPTPPPVDQATFAHGSVPLTGNTEPKTPVQNDVVANNGTWSSDWSGKAFSDSGEPPRAPSNNEVVVMRRSLTSDNTNRQTSTTGTAVAPKKVRAKARTGAGESSLTSTQSAHVALQDQLSQTAQTAGNIHAPPSAAPGTVAGPSSAETTGRGNKRRTKNAQAAVEPDTSQRQQHSTPEQQPAQYYGPSPEQRVDDPKKWIENHAPGGKGKKNQKRKAPEPKKTPTPRKSRKTKDATPTAPRSYRNIAPAPARTQDDATGVQVQSRANTPMGHNGATYSSPDVQMTGNGTHIHSAAPQMPHGRPQQIPQQSFQQQPQHQYFQPPVSQQDGFANPMQQQQQHASQADFNYWREKAQLEQQMKDLEQRHRMEAKDRRIAQLEQQLSQQNATESPQVMSNHSMPQGNWQPPQQGNWQTSLQGNAQTKSPNSLFREFQQGPHWQPSQQMSQPPMATPWMMSNQDMPSNGMAPHPTNMHGSYWQASPASGHPMGRGFHQNGYSAPMNFSQSVQGENVQGMHGDLNGGVGGVQMEENMPVFDC